METLSFDIHTFPDSLEVSGRKLTLSKDMKRVSLVRYGDVCIVFHGDVRTGRGTENLRYDTFPPEAYEQLVETLSRYGTASQSSSAPAPDLES